MSLATIVVIMGRIKTATEESPIAVFESMERGKLNAVFANTLMTRQIIAGKDVSYIGSFHSGMDREPVMALLRNRL